MACFWLNQNETAVEILSAEEVANITYYNISVTVGNVKWTVKHRYNEFYELHNRLVIDHGVSKDILPSKKVIRNKCPVFIENRRKGLEEYLQKVLVFLNRTMPKTFVTFLNFHLYDIFFLLHDLSLKFYSEADFILSASRTYTFSPLELHSISECLRNPYSIKETNNHKQLDLSSVLDLCSQLTSITVAGSHNPYMNSNIILNKLEFEFSSFKTVKCIILKNLMLNMIYSLGSLRTTVEELKVNFTNARSVSDILQCDKIHKTNLEGSEKWTQLEILDLSNNNIVDIDKTITLARNIKVLILNDNKISTISNLTHLPRLSYLSMTNNLLTVCNDLHTKIGNVKTLKLSQNNITSTKGFGKLYSLEDLDLSCNKIVKFEEVSYLGSLPCLEQLVLTGNSLATAVDYRVKVLEYFGANARNICLDNERPSQSELDKVEVMRALRIVKEGKTPTIVSISHT